MQCPPCHSENPPQAKFCLECASRHLPRNRRDRGAVVRVRGGDAGGVWYGAL